MANEFPRKEFVLQITAKIEQISSELSRSMSMDSFEMLVKC